MHVYKCDLCHKELKDDALKVYADTRAIAHNLFCENCGKPVLNFLKKHKLIPNPTKG